MKDKDLEWDWDQAWIDYVWERYSPSRDIDSSGKPRSVGILHFHLGLRDASRSCTIGHANNS